MSRHAGRQNTPHTLPYSNAAFAATYDQLSVPHQFAGPGRDLVSMLDLPAGAHVLDVGAGTGAATVPAVQALGPAGIVVALDPSLQMLAVLRAKCLARGVAGKIPGLPFPESAFDAVLGSFVLSHARNYHLALEDMARVLKPGGRLGVTAWALGGTDASQLWRSVATRFVSEENFARGFRELLPWDEWFSDPSHLHEALAGAHLLDIRIAQRVYRISVRAADFLAMKEASVEGRLLAESLSDEERDELKRQMTDAFKSRFKDGIEYTREVHFARGTKPAS